ncbi:hypothetical protein GYMLUDRAFT_46514 [Collybiopsis luxurians FD-317 M1]|uniref:Sodium/calcium exchanger membrane region domain-containing protein n=1 Tax=Collybiopsis luxurians FD-317 M1 TaxID=944289 RepID=A0A0D0B246_9AGAR|nr:hypothetical protein GYMLUDRAFT_46514 [Collybiopsis luxurians FD-317 M1]
MNDNNVDHESNVVSNAYVDVTHQTTPASPTLSFPSHSMTTESNISYRPITNTQQRQDPPLPEEPTPVNHTATLSTALFTPSRPVGPAPTMLQSFRSILFSSWLNLLLLCIPVSWALHFASDNDTLIFVFSFFAIIPLAKLLAFATDELSMRVGQTLAGLLNATLGNAVELIVAIIALTQCKLHIVQSSLIGSMLSNLLLVLGMCFFAGGIRFSEQGFGLIASQLNSSLLTIAVIAILLPAAFYYNVTAQTDPDEGADLLKVSHGVAIILLTVYGAYLYFQLVSHANLYNDGNDTFQSTKYTPKPKKAKTAAATDQESRNHSPVDGLESHVLPSQQRPSTPSSSRALMRPWDMASTAATTTAASVRKLIPHKDVEKGPNDLSAEGHDEEEEVPQMNLTATIVLLATVTVFVAITAEWLVDSISGLTENGTISQEFVGIILLPIVGNAAEHVTAVAVSVKDKLTLSLGVAIGSTLQIALFVIPFIVTLAWIMGKPLMLLFDPYESVTLFLAVLVVNYSIQDGKSNWLEGMILMSLYLILCVTFWYYPGSDPSGTLHQCT